MNSAAPDIHAMIRTEVSVELVFFSPLSPDELEDVVLSCTAEIEAYRARHPTIADRTGELTMGGTVPTVDEARAAHESYEEPFTDALAKKLAKIRSACTVTEPGDLELSPLQVSVVRYLVDRIDDGLALLIDYPLLTIAACIDELKGYKARDDFQPLDEDEGPDPLAALFGGSRAKKSSPKNKSRSEKILDMLEKARADSELALDAQKVLRRVSENARAYGAALFEFGPIDEAKAAAKLGLPEDAVIAAADELADALSLLFE
jgi:hypothetical protein